MSERLRRWRLVLGGDEADGTGVDLGPDDLRMDRSLEAVYDADRTGGLGHATPQVVRWLGDVRRYFPVSAVRVLQRDAVERLDLTRLLLEPELLDAVEPDVHLVGTLMALRDVLPDETRATARQVVAKVVAQVQKELKGRFVGAVRGAVDRRSRTRRPRGGGIDWDRTVRANLGNWQPDRRLLVAERVIGHARQQNGLHDVVLAVDQSGSMAASVVYAGVFAAALASLPALRTSLLAFDTRVVDLTAALRDPVDVLFGIQLGGGTDLAGALAAVAERVTRPTRTTAVVISDLFEGRPGDAWLAHAEEIVRSGATLLALLALSDEGRPAYDVRNAARLAALGVPVFACTPDRFGALLAAAIEGRDLGLWAAREGIVGVRGEA